MADRKNRFGGGGNQFHYIFTQRQGNYGFHQTIPGKVVYQRPRHYWNTADLLRVVPKVIVEEEKTGGSLTEPRFTWWEKAINLLADWMLSRILVVMSIDEDFAKVGWSFVMTFWMKIVQKLVPGDARFAESLNAYSQRLTQSIREYQKGSKEKETLIETLYKDVVGL